MLNFMISSFFNHFIEIEIGIMSLRRNRESCERNCSHLNGRMPYLFEGIGSKMNFLGTEEFELKYAKIIKKMTAVKLKLY